MNMETNSADFLHGLKSIKWFRSHIENFNAAVSYHADVLSTCKSNITKQYRLQNFTAARQERLIAERTIRHLRKLLVDIKQLRDQVVVTDLPKFDMSVCQSQDRAISALERFNEFYESLSLLPDVRNSSKSILPPSQGIEFCDTNQKYPKQEQMLQIHEDQWVLETELEVAQEMKKIEEDSKIVNEIFSDLAKLINGQKTTVDQIEEKIEGSHVQVEAAQKELARAAAKIHGAIYPVVGALIGTCIAGPVGLVAGIKTGSVIAVAATGSVLGFSGGRVLKKRQQKVKNEILGTETGDTAS